MGANCAISAGAQTNRCASKTCLAEPAECDVLCGQKWMCLACLASRFSFLENRLPLLSVVSSDWLVATTQYHHTRSGSSESRQTAAGQCHDCGQPIGEKCRRR